jgi:hypothetical protein
MEGQIQPEINTELDNFFNLSFDAGSREQLKQTALWSKITSICGFISYFIALIVNIFGHNKTYNLDGTLNDASSFRVGNFIGTLIVVVVGGILNYILYRFAVAVGQGVQSMDALKVNTGFNSLHQYFKMLGILLIIGLSLLLLIILVLMASTPRFT